MAAFVKFNQFVTDLGKKVHNLSADALKIYLTNTAPTVASNAIKTDLAEIANANGYSAPVSITNAYSGSGGTGTLTGVSPTITAAGGTVGPFRYAVLYNSTSTTPLNPLIGYWDYGSSITLNDTETFTVTFGASVMTIV